jgi:DNA polymerase-3 subunit alpha
MSSLIKNDLLPSDTEEYILAKRVYEFNRYLKAICKYNATDYRIDERAINFLTELGLDSIIEVIENNFYVNVKKWDKVYQSYMDVFRSWMAQNQNDILQSLNEKIFLEDWNKYAKGNISSWEMEVLCFYYHEHELKNVNTNKYGFVNFFNLPEEPIVDHTFVRGGKEVHLYKLHKICGTCIAKNKTKSTVTLLTPDGVVEVKFRKEYFSLFDKQISERGEDGVKHVKEKSWFNRGNMIVVMGVRNGDNFVAKKYSSSSGHQLYHIDSIDKDGDLVLRSTRYQGDIEEDE